MSRLFDVVILGSGFAGSLLGWLLRTQGLSVLIVDRQKHPRFAIGESSTPAADFILESLCDEYHLDSLRPLCRYGTWCRQQPVIQRGIKRGFSYFHHRTGEPFASDSSHARELIVAASANDEVSDTHWYRADVDEFLARSYRTAGGELWEATTITSLRSGKHWELICGRNDVHEQVAGKFLIDGTGGQSGLIDLLQLNTHTSGLLTRSRSLFGHFHNVSPWENILQSLHVSREDYPFPCDRAALHHIIEGGWMWQLRFDNGITSVGWSLDERRYPLPRDQSPEEEWDTLLKSYPSIAEQLQQSIPALRFADGQSLIRTGSLQRRVTPAAGANWALLPSTASFIDPFYSTGIAQSLLGIRRLAAIIPLPDNEKRISALMNYSRTVDRETTLIDQLVALAFQTMGGDPRQLHAASMLYFAAATTFETRYRRGETGAFLLADDEAFRDVVKALCRSYPERTANDRDINAWVAQVETCVQPWNHAGLFHPDCPGMYRYTATK